ncbi:ATP-binding cassette domain-containing protein [Actinomadura litoris]|uniref:ATP-binding cassette domain-containing protein n=1 Tax=Actinomadura litoris TaxID=2678616 RepID=UPI001FA7CF81|nr:ATP-binding cassette domain-containing protein [Actinomadura litoris]
MTYAIQADGLVKRFGDTEALAGVSLTAQAGTVLGVLGPNGAGKTTTTRILATLIEPTGGSARVGGFDVVKEAHKVRQLIGLTGQYAGVDEMLTGTENLILIGRLLGIPRRESRARAAELLERFQLTEAAERAAKTYSGGMRRRLDLAASLVGRPQILFLDEPTTGLDPRSRNGLWDIVRGLTDDGVTVLLTTQYLEEADQLADDIVVIDRGQVIAHGTSDTLKSQVGGQVLEVRPLQESDVAAASRIVGEMAGAEPEARDGMVSVPITDPQLMPAVVRRLDDAGVTVGELSLRKSSLDEVFFALTGHHTDDIEAEADALAGSTDLNASDKASDKEGASA